MALKVNTNDGSVHSQRLAIDGSDPVRSSFRRLSAGLRITTPAEDATDAALSERLRAEVRSVEQSRREANDGIALLKTVEGHLVETNALLERLRKLASQALDNGAVEVDTAIDDVRSLRISLDAVHQRLVQTLESLSPPEGFLNLDRAFGTATRTRRAILEQASTAILGQANAQAEAAFLLLHLQGTRKPTSRSRDFRS